MKKKGFLGYLVAHPTAANLLMIIFLVMGLLTVPKLLRQTFPDFASTEVKVSVIYPGASAADVEEAICQRIEDKLEGLTNLDEITSTAVEGLATIVVTMEDGGDIQQFLDDIRTEVDAITDFPADAEAPIISLLNRTDRVVSIAVTGPMSLPHLKLYCEKLKDKLLQVSEIGPVEIDGFSDHEIRIEVPATKLMELGLSVSKLADVISKQSLDLPAGSVKTSAADILVRFSDQRRKIAEFEDLVIKSGSTGAEVRLGDIATITDRFDLDEDKIIFNGKRAGLLVIQKTKQQDALRALDAVKAFIDKESRLAPKGVTLTLTSNITKIVRDRLNLLTTNGMQGLVLVFLVMWLFFNIRLSFWVAMGLPVSFMGAIFVMHVAGLTLNMLTMVGLLLALGLIMDDAIVISENVVAELRKGKSPFRAAVDGTKVVAAGVMSSFATTVFIFGSIALLIEGRIGKVMWVMPAVLIMTLSVSLVEAFCILPNHMAHALHDMNKPPNRFRVWFEDRFERFRERVLGNVVDWAIEWRYLFAGMVIAIFLVSISMLGGGVLKMIAFPEIDGDVYEARVLLPQGTPLKRTEAVVKRLTDALERVNKKLTPLQPGKKKFVESVSIYYNKNDDSGESGPHVVTIVADLLNAESRTSDIETLSRMWRKEVGVVPDVLNIAYKEPAIGPGGLPINIRLQGSDLKDLKSASSELMKWLNQYNGVRDLSDDLRPGKPEYLARLKPGATALGLDSGTIANQLRSALQGRKSAEIQSGGESYDITVMLSSEDRNSIGDLEYFHVTTGDGKQIPLGAVATLEESRGYARIARVNSLRTVTIKGDLDTSKGNANEIVNETKKLFMPKLQEKYPDITFMLEGQAKEGAKTGKSMVMALGIGILGIFVLLSFQFKSYVEPIVVISAIPLAFIGVVWGHLLMGLNLSMVSIMGFASLAGVVVNDSILLVEFVRMRMRDGMTTPDAAAMASRQRFRAVLLTSLTTIVGLVPLLTERSLQAQVLIPLATSLVFGLLTSTGLVLLVVPTFYTILDDLGLTRSEEGINGDNNVAKDL